MGDSGHSGDGGVTAASWGHFYLFQSAPISYGVAGGLCLFRTAPFPRVWGGGQGFGALIHARNAGHCRGGRGGVNHVLVLLSCSVNKAALCFGGLLSASSFLPCPHPGPPHPGAPTPSDSPVQGTLPWGCARRARVGVCGAQGCACGAQNGALCPSATGPQPEARRNHRTARCGRHLPICALWQGQPGAARTPSPPPQPLPGLEGPGPVHPRSFCMGLGPAGPGSTCPTSLPPEMPSGSPGHAADLLCLATSASSPSLMLAGPSACPSSGPTPCPCSREGGGLCPLSWRLPLPSLPGAASPAQAVPGQVLGAGPDWSRGQGAVTAGL